LKKPVQGVYFQRRFTSTPPWHIDALFPWESSWTFARADSVNRG
jgi:hypothetical protein